LGAKRQAAKQCSENGENSGAFHDTSIISAACGDVTLPRSISLASWPSLRIHCFFRSC
jgi:hypothetical protein